MALFDSLFHKKKATTEKSLAPKPEASKLKLGDTYDKDEISADISKTFGAAAATSIASGSASLKEPVRVEKEEDIEVPHTIEKFCYYHEKRDLLVCEVCEAENIRGVFSCCVCGAKMKG